MQVWRHPTDDTIRVQYDEDSIAEFDVLCEEPTWVGSVPSDWIELVPELLAEHRECSRRWKAEIATCPDNGLAESNGWLAYHSPPEDRP